MPLHARNLETFWVLCCGYCDLGWLFSGGDAQPAKLLLKWIELLRGIMYCNHCGKKAEVSAKFCQFCGSAVDGFVNKQGIDPVVEYMRAKDEAEAKSNDTVTLIVFGVFAVGALAFLIWVLTL